MCYAYLTMLTKQKKQKIIKTAAIHETDTGSAEVQISLLSRRIEELTTHLKKNQKDFHSRRGLLQMVADRQNMTNYLKRKDVKRFNALVKKLDLKKK
jgi:small subunit ribosomal protein S15